MNYLMTPADIEVLTSDGCRIAVHSRVLASASSTLENLVYSSLNIYRSDHKAVINISCMKPDVVITFLHCIYSPRSALSMIEGIELQLFVLAHKYKIRWLKEICEKEIMKKLNAHMVVDVLHISKICNASRLKVKCLNFVCKNFDLVQKSDSWRFVQKNDPRLEHEIMQFMHDTDQRKKRWRKCKAQQELYGELSEAMDCLNHICAEGCSHVGPCEQFQTCEGLRLFIRHFVVCRVKVSSKGTCSRCYRMGQLFRLHSSLCDVGGSCRVPLCKQLKVKGPMELKEDDGTWRLLVKKVNVARVMLSFTRRERPKQLDIV